MKKQIVEFLPKVIIVWFAVVLGIWANEWRVRWLEKTKMKEVYRTLKIELNQAKGFVRRTDASTSVSINDITSLLIHDRLPDYRLLQLFSSCVSQFTNDLNGIMNHSMSLIDANIHPTVPNDSLAQYSAYIHHILEDHARINSGIHEIANQQLWPILDNYSITLDLNDYQKGVQNIENLKGNYLSVVADKEIRSILRQIRYKKNEQRVIYEILIAHIDKIIHELEKETK